MKLDEIVFEEPLLKEKTRYDKDIVILPVQQNETDILPYYLQLKVGEVDPNFPSFSLRVTIDGYKSKTSIFREVKDGVMKLKTFDKEYLEFGPRRAAGSRQADTKSNK